MNELLFALWFFLPAGFANMAPLFANKIPWVNSFSYPIDGFRFYRGQRILGDHKTIRGLLSGIILGSIIAVIQQWFTYDVIHFSFIPASFLQINPVLFGGLSGCGALVGDSVKSFFKRQRHIPSGKTWFPWDQIDYIVGGITFTFFVYRLTAFEYVLLFICYFLLHLVISYIGFLLHFKKVAI